MIFPILRGILWFHRAPLTWILCAINLSFYLWTNPAYIAADRALEEIYDDEDFVRTNGLLYAGFLAESKLPTTFESRLVPQAQKGQLSAQTLLGHLGFRSATFFKKFDISIRDLEIPVWQKVGDRIRIEEWLKKNHEIRKIESVHPSYRWGLSQRQHQIGRLLSYQFSHSGVTHLFWNMFFLLIFGTFLEQLVGHFAVLLTYLVSGFMGAASFILFNGLSNSPLVGASAAVSGLIAWTAMQREFRLPFFYWLLPFKGYYGLALLPAWVLIPAYLLPDLAGVLSGHGIDSSIAHSAHLGGAIAGIILSLLIKPDMSRLRSLREELAEINSYFPKLARVTTEFN